MDNESMLTGKRILVTGGSGVIGRELLHRLTALDAEIITVDRNPLPPGDWGKIAEVRKDIADDDIDELIQFRPEVIFHLAAAFERSKESPDFWKVNWHDNVCVNNRIADIMVQTSSVETYIFASSYLVHSEEQYFFQKSPEVARLLKEEDSKNPRNLCGAAKFYAEHEMHFIKGCIAPMTRMVMARIYRVYGKGSNDVVSRWVRSALNGESVDLYNKDNRFDYIYAGDVAEGLIRMADNESVSGAVNLGSGRARSVDELLTFVRERMSDAALDVCDRGCVEEYEASCADVSRLLDLTGWRPTTNLEQGVDIILEWEQQQRIAHEQ